MWPVALHAAANYGAVEHAEGGEQRGGAVPLVIVRHGLAAPGSAVLKTTHTCCAMAPIPKPWPSIAYPDAFVNPLNDSKH